MRSAIDANLISTPFPIEYQDVHVIAGVLKSYLRDLPDPLLTFNLYDKFIAAAQQQSEEARKAAILSAIKQLPEKNYLNLRYLMKFLGTRPSNPFVVIVNSLSVSQSSWRRSINQTKCRRRTLRL